MVVLDKETYISKMVSIISDETKFEKLSSLLIKYTLKVEDKVNNFLRKVKDEGVISSEIYSQIFSSGSAPGILYGLPKIQNRFFLKIPV